MGSEEEKAILLRTIIFGFSVAALAAVSAYFVFGVITQPSDVELSVSGTYTVRIMQVGGEKKDQLARLEDSDELKSIFGVDDLFIISAGGGEYALCAGRFDSKNSEEARALLTQAKNFESAGTRPFSRADIWFVSSER